MHLIYKTEGDAKTARSADVPIVPTDESFIPLLDKSGVNYSATQPSACAASAGWLAPLMLMGFLWVFLFRRDSGAPPGVATFGKSQAKLAPEEGTGVSFDERPCSTTLRA